MAVCRDHFLVPNPHHHRAAFLAHHEDVSLGFYACLQVSWTQWTPWDKIRWCILRCDSHLLPVPVPTSYSGSHCTTPALRDSLSWGSTLLRRGRTSLSCPKGPLFQSCPWESPWLHLPFDLSGLVLPVRVCLLPRKLQGCLEVRQPWKQPPSLLGWVSSSQFPASARNILPTFPCLSSVMLSCGPPTRFPYFWLVRSSGPQFVCCKDKDLNYRCHNLQRAALKYYVIWLLNMSGSLPWGDNGSKTVARKTSLSTREVGSFSRVLIPIWLPYIEHLHSDLIYSFWDFFFKDEETETFMYPLPLTHGAITIMWVFVTGELCLSPNSYVEAPMLSSTPQCVTVIGDTGL